MKQVFIRVDGNEMIATGHVMRCLSIAEQLRKRNIEVVFVTADDSPCAMIREKGFSVDILESVWNNLDEETEKLCSYISKHRVEILLLDSYYVTKEYLKRISECTKIIYMDDLHQFAYPVHTLINYDAFIEAEWYEEIYQSTEIKPSLLLGSLYIPLREEFTMLPYEVREQMKKVLITTGGTDQLNVAGSVLHAGLCSPALKKLEYHVIVGCFNQNKDLLYSLADTHPNIHLHENVKNISEWMRKCDAAISASGTTLYELCACGMPTICLEVADNQEGASVWEENGYMLYAGNACIDKENCIQRSIAALKEYNSSYEQRRKKSKRMQSLVDGNGAGRIAEYICKILR